MMEHESSSNPSEVSREILRDLATWAALRLGEAIQRQQEDPNAIWFTDSASEGISWYRLGATHEIGALGEERFDVGVPIKGEAEEEKTPHDDNSKNDEFYVRKESRHGEYREEIVNLLSAAAFAGVQTTEGKGPIIKELQRKLSSYPLHPMRVRREV